MFRPTSITILRARGEGKRVGDIDTSISTNDTYIKHLGDGFGFSDSMHSY